MFSDYGSAYFPYKTSAGQQHSNQYSLLKLVQPLKLLDNAMLILLPIWNKKMGGAYDTNFISNNLG